jgi:hypothetical protein
MVELSRCVLNPKGNMAVVFLHLYCRTIIEDWKSECDATTCLMGLDALNKTLIN